MKGKATKFDQLSDIFSHFSEKNKKNLVKIARDLLKLQKENKAMVAGNAGSPAEGERLGMV